MHAFAVDTRACRGERSGWATFTTGPGHARRRRGPRGEAFGFAGPPWFRGRGPRAGRGDVRAAILALLAEEPMHGYQIMRELTERSGGVWRPSPGSIYPTLQLLEDEGLVRGEESEGGRRLFHLTDEGREAAAAGASAQAPWDVVAAGGDERTLAFRDLAVQVMVAARQVAQAGEPAQVDRAMDVLRETRRRLYGILAEDTSADA